MTRITAGRYTTTTDVTSANDETYQNWRTFRLTWHAKGTYLLSVLSNKDGNGQTWNAIGTIANRHLTITEVASHSTPFSHDALLLTCVSLFCSHKGLTTTVMAPGSFPNAKTWKIKKGSKRTAAPTLLRPTEVRDRNVNNARLVANDRFAALMSMGRAKSDTQMVRITVTKTTVVVGTMTETQTTRLVNGVPTRFNTRTYR